MVIVYSKFHSELKLENLQKEPDEREYILQKRPLIWRSLLIEATLYVVIVYSKFHRELTFENF